MKFFSDPNGHIGLKCFDRSASTVFVFVRTLLSTEQESGFVQICVFVLNKSRLQLLIAVTEKVFCKLN